MQLLEQSTAVKRSFQCAALTTLGCKNPKPETTQKPGIASWRHMTSSTHRSQHQVEDDSMVDLFRGHNSLTQKVKAGQEQQKEIAYQAGKLQPTQASAIPTSRRGEQM
jgi:hypothetical protein